MKYEKKNKKFMSPVTQREFFLSEMGASDADLELKKSLEVFSLDLPASDQHPQCQYPARYEILRKHFALAKPVHCPSFELWYKNYQPTQIKILYGSQYISTPTSAFGHSFFLIDSNKTLEYMRTTYNYGAEIPENVGARLVIDGLGGGFKGTMSVTPLYERLYSYNDIENRDIWEYGLSLTDEERDFIIKYLRETEKYFSAPYYFLNGNCASEILEILNVMRPELNLKTSSPLFTSPQEIFRVFRQHNLVSGIQFRPSLQKRLDKKWDLLSYDQKKNFQNSVENKKLLTNDPRVNEAIISYLSLIRQKNRGTTPTDLQSLERETLLSRAQQGELEKFDYPSHDWPEPPHKAQGPNLIEVGRTRLNSTQGTKIVVRPAFHDRMQTDAGFLPNSSVDILTFDGQIPDGKSARLDNFTLGRIENYREVKYYDPLAPSWSVGAKITRNKFQGDKLHYNLEATPEIGLATSVGSPTVLAFALMGFDYRDRAPKPFGVWGFGPRIGVIGSLGRFKTYVSQRFSWQSADASAPLKKETEIQLRYNLNQQWDLLAEYSRIDAGNGFHHFDESTLSLRLSF